MAEAVFLVTGVALINHLACSSFLLSSLPYIFIENIYLLRIYTGENILQYIPALLYFRNTDRISAFITVNSSESWTVKKAERQRIDAFELWCWRRLLRVPWTARRSNQSILKEISPGCSLEGMMLKLKLQYFGNLMGRVDSLEKTDAGRDWGKEEKGMTEDKMAGLHHRLDGHEFE